MASPSWWKPCARCCQGRCPLAWNATLAISTSLQRTISRHLRRSTLLKKIWTRCSNGYGRLSQRQARNGYSTPDSWNTRKNASGGSTASRCTKRSFSGLRRLLANWASHRCQRCSGDLSDCPLSPRGRALSQGEGLCPRVRRAPHHVSRVVAKSQNDHEDGATDTGVA